MGRLMNASGCFQSVSKERKMESYEKYSQKIIGKYAEVGCSAGVVVFHPDAPNGELTRLTRQTRRTRQLDLGLLHIEPLVAGTLFVTRPNSAMGAMLSHPLVQEVMGKTFAQYTPSGKSGPLADWACAVLIVFPARRALCYRRHSHSPAHVDRAGDNIFVPVR